MDEIYLVVQSAINNSELTEEIKKLNRKLEESGLIQEESLNDQDQDQSHDKVLTNEIYEKCPGCAEKVLLNGENCPACGCQVFLKEKECRSCGLKLRDAE
ncbi:hypothetical protein [Chengkuizengella axinellae]|uniref:Zinc ribbon domain-containing protein n=1 Tax=Chengkuizengella axinellae TaxID=3064388 RepID=A0ABT9J2S8_9BACL|nr:hypothetical protein [Chengkuizengella sp. 2205SS18-9]MDP5275309.1 hypothetical protein [Chengkuizengella sp. 2205SS18-9]